MELVQYGQPSTGGATSRGFLVGNVAKTGLKVVVQAAAATLNVAVAAADTSTEIAPGDTSSKFLLGFFCLTWKNSRDALGDF